MSFTYRPLVWTGPRTPADQRRSIFKAGWSDTIDKLDTEIYYLSGSELVLEADFREQDLRIDGLPRANARQPEFPGIKISFNTPRLGRLEYATDTHTFWQHNVRAIALSLEALRAVDRYGTTSGRQQYTGFKAIGSAPSSLDSRRQAATFIAEHSAAVGTSISREADTILAAPDMAITAARRAAKRLHPDAGGSAELFRQLQEAKAVLGL